MQYAYPYEISTEADGVTLTFPDVSGAITCGATEAEAVARAEDALVSMLAALVDDGASVPVPSQPAGRPVAVVPLLEAAKLALHSAMLAGKVSNVELAGRLGIDEKAVRRLRDPLHRSHVGQVTDALRELGQRVGLEVVEAA